ncbi:MAG: hypothetical protein K0A89_00270 [ANME-2 cluster archaeon]|nr:hypothetical protein [ANME-2 cluster archaeon]
MALATEFLTTSINNLRVAEDSISAILLLIIIGILIHTNVKIVKKGPTAKGLWGLTIGLLPFLFWKLLGAIRRIFIESSNPLYTPLSNFGEVMEAVSALTILVSLLFMYLMIRPRK